MPEQSELLALAAHVSESSANILPARTIYPSYAYTEPEPEETSVPLSHYVWVLKRHKWSILAFVVTAVAATIVVSSRLTPIYESTSTIDIDRQAPAGFIGQDASRMAPNDADQFLATQVNAIQSDSVLRPVVERFQVRISEVGKQRGKLPSARAQNAPVTLKNLKVTRPRNTYLLLISYRSPDPELAANVANGVAQSYIEHTYNIRFRATAGLSAFMEKQIEEMKAKMERSSAALFQFEKDLSVINPDEKTSILSSRLLQLNTEFTTAQADRVRRQAAFNSTKGGSLQAAQASLQGEQLRRMADRVDEAREKFAVVKTQYGAGHPEYKKVSAQLTELERQFDAMKRNVGQRVDFDYQEAVNREAMLKTAVQQTKAEFDKLNARSFEYKAVKQEAETDKKFYDELLHKIKEAGINSSFQNNSIRLSDSARPALLPVFPNIRLNGILALLFSILLAIGAAVMADTLDNTVRDPEQIQKRLKTEVLGALPLVRNWYGRSAPLIHGPETALVTAGRRNSQTEAFEESIRMVRDTILLSDLSRRTRSLLMTSATPREGKTTTAVHLAIAHSLQNHRTLLIDADLRRPSIHVRLGIPNQIGVSTVIKGDAEWRGVLQKSAIYPDLDILPAGPASRRAADLLGAFLAKVLSEAEDDYDLVIVDAPPVLGFAEALKMATLVDGVVVVALAGQTDRNAVASVLTNLKRLKQNVIGIVLNEVRDDMKGQYYYYGYQNYSKYYHPTNA